MTHIRIPHDPQGDMVGAWWKTADGCVNIRCPQCGWRGRLRDPLTAAPRADGTHGHDIAPDGGVSPSIVCGHVGCSWHVWGILEGWTP